MNSALLKFGINVSDRKKLKPFIGPPLKPSYMKYFGFDEKKAEEAVAYYREYYSNGGMFDCYLYDGIEKLLEEMSNKYKLVLATSKPQPFAEKILEKFNLTKFFYLIVGATFDDKVSEKKDVLKKALFDSKASPEKSVMIGDRCFDTDGAADNGMHLIGVTYGYGAREEFSKSEKVFDTVEEMFKFFCE